MKLTFLGTGSAFTTKNYQSNMLLEAGGRKMLIDCGGDARYALRDAGTARVKDSFIDSYREALDTFFGKVDVPTDAQERIIYEILAAKYPQQAYNAKDIDALYVSHCHADHVGGIEWLGFMRYFSQGTKPDLFINERLSGTLWNDSLRGGMASHQGVILNLDSFFNKVHRIGKNGSFKFGGVRCQLVQTIHYMDGYEIVPSYGLLMKVQPDWLPSETPPDQAVKMSKEIFLTTDTQFAPHQIMDFYRRADLILQDCETAPWKSGVHAHYLDLKTLPPEIKAKMWLYHYNDFPLPDAVADGFAGFIKKGQTFEF